MTTTSKAPIVVVGVRSVGLITAVGFAARREVRLVDVDEQLIQNLEAGKMPIHEDRLLERFEAVRERLTFHTKLEDALSDGRPQLVFVAVGTPTKTLSPRDLAVTDRDRSADLEGDGVGMAADLEAAEEVVNVLMGYRGLAVVMKSTVPPGTGAEMLERARESNSDLAYLSCPEFLQEGRAFDSFDKPDRIVAGYQDSSPASEALYELHAEVHPNLKRLRLDDEGSWELSIEALLDSARQESGLPYLEMGLQSAEFVKHASNLYLAARVSYANSIANLCEEVGADVRTVMCGVGADTRIGPKFLEPGAGFGGSCFGKDLRALSYVAAGVGVDTSFAEAVLAVNRAQAARIVMKLERRLDSLQGARVAILGLAFKPGTDDLRGSPAFALATSLRREGATLQAWDPDSLACTRAIDNYHHRREGGEWMTSEEIADSAIGAMVDADAVVLVTAWPDFGDIDWHDAASVMAGQLVVDGRNALSPDVVGAAGLEYEGTGRRSRGLGRPLLEGAAEG
jgi:UDPglucose 6-dehydrogenase